MTAHASTAEPASAATSEDKKLRRHLGFWQLTAIGFSGVIGSGWLLGAAAAALYDEFAQDNGDKDFSAIITSIRDSARS